ncbi:MAG TPA: hypothetical protein PKM16_09685 [Bacteroidia bacterium]|nr:hypothetical protein [Bacteroidia bacterium]
MKKTLVTLLMMFFFSIVSTYAEDIISLKNTQSFKGKISSLNDHSITLRIKSTSYIIPSQKLSCTQLIQPYYHLLSIIKFGGHS